MIPENSRRGILLSTFLKDAEEIRDISDLDDRHVRYIIDYIKRTS